MKLDMSSFSFLTSNDYRVLLAIELGMRNHEYLSGALISKLSNLRRVGINKVLVVLLKNKLITHINDVYDGYKLTYLGYDFLALHTFWKRGFLQSIGSKIGVGKESDIYICKDVNNNFLCLKIHRLGRISFRTIKNNRDYYGKKKFKNWLYLSKIAATKEYAYLKVLYENKFPVPKPYDLNRHMILMSYINAYPLSHVKLRNPLKTVNFLFNTIMKFAEASIIHGDFNEFNILIDEDDNITVIDFPQIVSLEHTNAEIYFERDVKCILDHFYKKYKILITDYPTYKDAMSIHKGQILDTKDTIKDKHNDALMRVLHNDNSECDSVTFSSDNDNIYDSNMNEEKNELILVQKVENGSSKNMDLDQSLTNIIDNPNTDDIINNVLSVENDENECNHDYNNIYKFTRGEEDKKENNLFFLLDKNKNKLNEKNVSDINKQKNKKHIIIESGKNSEQSNVFLDEEGINSNNNKEVDKSDNYINTLNFKRECDDGLFAVEVEGVDGVEDVEEVKEIEEVNSDSNSNRIDSNGNKIDSNGNRIDSNGSCDNTSSEYSEQDSGSENNIYTEPTKKLSDTWSPHIKKYTKEYAKTKLKHMYRKKKHNEKYKESLKTKNKKKLMETIKCYL
ncbi:serine/threonine protein kinase RIO2 [Hepatocystis sp. ex Piliocolobus tephrosceles]|nr:serine/threonine protein kinase RIO2 [Hepatocystis sp. ex Piliocolobus tephrosceles]